MLTSVALAIGLGAASVLAQTTATASLIAELELAPDHIDRVADLPEDSEFTFDFLNPPSAGIVQGAAGHLVLASVVDFPALVGNKIAMLAGFLGPCGMNTPHWHPRATEFLYQVNGSVQSGMLTETGSRFIINTVNAGEAMLLPQGSIHFQFNDNCEPVQFISALNSEDPGTLLAAQGLFGLPPAIVAASLGEIGVEEVAGLAHLIPDDVAFGSQECLTRCGITVGIQPTAEQVPRVSGNAFPSGTPATFSTYAASKATSTSTAVPTNQSQARSIGGAIADAATASSGTTKSTSHSTTVALIIVVCVMSLGYVALGVMYLIRRRQNTKMGPRFNSMYVERPGTKGRSIVPTVDSEVKYDLSGEPYDPTSSALGGSRYERGDA